MIACTSDTHAAGRGAGYCHAVQHSTSASMPLSEVHLHEVTDRSWEVIQAVIADQVEVRFLEALELCQQAGQRLCRLGVWVKAIDNVSKVHCKVNVLLLPAGHCPVITAIIIYIMLQVIKATFMSI